MHVRITNFKIIRLVIPSNEKILKATWYAFEDPEGIQDSVDTQA